MIYVEDMREDKKLDITDQLAESGLQTAADYAHEVTCSKCAFGTNGVCEAYFWKCIGGLHEKAD